MATRGSWLPAARAHRGVNKLRTSTELKVVIERRGNALTFVYKIK